MRSNVIPPGANLNLQGMNVWPSQAAAARQHAVNAMLALRNAICSDRWVEVWTQIEEEQRREERARRRERQRQRRVSAPRNAGERWEVEGRACLQRGGADSSASAVPVAPPNRLVAESGRPAASHPWRKAWSIRRQREIASTA